jgi:hypothetical protein
VLQSSPCLCCCAKNKRQPLYRLCLITNDQMQMALTITSREQTGGSEVQMVVTNEKASSLEEA